MKTLLELFRGLSLRTDPLYLVRGAGGGVNRFTNSLEDAKAWAECGWVGEVVTITRVGCFTNKREGVYRVQKANPYDFLSKFPRLARIL